MHKYPIYLLAALASLPLAAFAATTAAPAAGSGTAKAPVISDKDALKYLNAADQKQYQADLKTIADATQEVAEGNKLKALKPDPNAAIKDDVTAKNKEGDAKIKEGNAKIKLTNADLNQLRDKAVKARDVEKANAQAASEATLQIGISQWPDVFSDMATKIMDALADAKYRQVYLDNIYVFDGTNYSPNAALTEQVRAVLAKADKGKNILAAKQDWKFSTGIENGTLVISYDKRSRDLSDNIKTVVFVGEIINEPRSGFATLSLRAVDVVDMHIVTAQSMLLSVEPTMAKMLNVPIYKVMAKRNAPGPDGKPLPPETAISVNLKDPNDVFTAAKKAQYEFRIAPAGSATLENRFAALMLKTYLLTEQPDLAVSDQDFLTLALGAAKSDQTPQTPNVGAEWVLPDVSEISDDMELSKIKLHNLNNNADKDMGKLTIKRDLPKLAAPTIDDLRLGGYE